MVDPSERMFYQNRCSRGNNFATQTRLGLVLCAMLCGLIAGCLAEPRRVEMGRAGRAHALANYAWDDIARRLEDTYLEVAA